MKAIILFTIVFFSFTARSQDTTKVGQIDSLVKSINTSTFKIQRDTIKQDYPEMGLSMQTYLTMVSDENELKKYVNNVHMTTQENGKAKQTVTANIFYFDRNKLIEVEDFMAEDGKEVSAFWYYADDKPIYYTLRSDKAQARGELLVTIAKSMVAKMKL